MSAQEITHDHRRARGPGRVDGHGEGVMEPEGPHDDMLGPALEHAGDTKLAPAHGIAALALSLALKYHDISTVQDGTLYQQYKLEGRNMEILNIDRVFETAIRIEAHLMASSDRIAGIVMDAISTELPDEDGSETTAQKEAS